MFSRRRSPDDFAAEIQAHIALEAARLRSEGLSESDAEYAARRAFGNVVTITEQFYETSGWLWWDEICKDLYYAVRTLRQNPVFTLSAVLTLALGIGANTAIFSLIDAALLRPLPYPNPERIVALYGRLSSGKTTSLAPAAFLDYRRQAGSFDQLAAFRGRSFNVSGHERPESIDGVDVTPQFFAVLGVRAQLGRTLTAEQDAPGLTRTVVLSYALWERWYAANPEVLGQTLRIDGEPRTIVGVMPPYFQYPPACELWTSARYAVPEHPRQPYIDQSNVRNYRYFDVIGRLKAGTTLITAQAEADTIASRLRKQYGSFEAERAAVVTLQNDLFGETKPALLVMVAAVSLLLVIACANVANLLLARGVTRQKEIAIRGALGAGRARLVRQFLTESVTLGVAGGAAGILFASWGLTPVRALLPTGLSTGTTLRLDARVLAFTAVVSIGSAILFGLFPALQAAAGFDLIGVLKEDGRGIAAGSRAGRARSMLVISEVALAGVLLIGAGLLLRSFSRLLAISEGFEPEHVLSLQLSL
ncbi:MAG TPA: ABC transporter permease, partial [Bryobacteraceae bacterium]|nr:ABC transporter permease [Bryobacteraceae bacterium]